MVIVPNSEGPNESLKLDAQSGELKERKFTGSGSDTDIITSSARAYVTALNKLLQWQIRRMGNGPTISDSSNGIGNAVPVAGEGPLVVSK